MSRPLGIRDQHGKCVRSVSSNEARLWATGIGSRIRHRRQELDVSVLELAAALGVCDKTVHKWERGENMTPTTELYRVATALGIQVIDLLEDG